MASSSLRGALLPFFLMGPSILLLGLVFVAPLLIMLSYSLYVNNPSATSVPELTLDNYIRLLVDDLYYRVIWSSV